MLGMSGVEGASLGVVGHYLDLSDTFMSNDGDS